MRPRPDAAENRWSFETVRSSATGFNEAAARCRGKPRGASSANQGPPLASMRPRPDAAENASSSRNGDFLTIVLQ